MKVLLNNDIEQTLSTVDGTFLRGFYTVAGGETVAKLSVKRIESANIIGLNSLPGTQYTIPAEKNLSNLKSIAIKTSTQKAVTVCKNEGLYRKCPVIQSGANSTEYQANLLCEGIITASQAQRTQKRASRLDVLNMAVNMARATTEDTVYTGTFSDITDSMKPVF